MVEGVLINWNRGGIYSPKLARVLAITPMRKKHGYLSRRSTLSLQLQRSKALECKSLRKVDDSLEHLGELWSSKPSTSTRKSLPGPARSINLQPLLERSPMLPFLRSHTHFLADWRFWLELPVIWWTTSNPSKLKSVDPFFRHWPADQPLVKAWDLCLPCLLDLVDWVS